MLLRVLGLEDCWSGSSLDVRNLVAVDWNFLGSSQNVVFPRSVGVPNVILWVYSFLPALTRGCSLKMQSPNLEKGLFN
ncbi:hypothetical protein GDO81_000582 [Engystomops pustulosus]|uniref:Uncharacterized protein n=1 Tax=Engystomops pustulosus TaxID=76066 RepID=A0AAV7D5G5_ENGPU|nr:hypothetical protein GDO81_000582 [Engystomops pustulosus]